MISTPSISSLRISMATPPDLFPFLVLQIERNPVKCVLSYFLQAYKVMFIDSFSELVVVEFATFSRAWCLNIPREYFYAIFTMVIHILEFLYFVLTMIKILGVLWRIQVSIEFEKQIPVQTFFACWEYLWSFHGYGAGDCQAIISFPFVIGEYGLGCNIHW